jgi:PilZ domain
MLITLPKRRPKRVRLLLNGHLTTPAGKQNVRIRDVSTNGMLVEATDPPAVGETVTVGYAELELEGSVVWCEGSWAGIRFDQDLSGPTWDDLTAKQLRVGAPRRYRHDRIEEDEPQIEVTPRSIRMRLFGR